MVAITSKNGVLRRRRGLLSFPLFDLLLDLLHAHLADRVRNDRIGLRPGDDHLAAPRADLAHCCNVSAGRRAANTAPTKKPSKLKLHDVSHLVPGRTKST